jgi:hypothetical protein
MIRWKMKILESELEELSVDTEFTFWGPEVAVSPTNEESAVLLRLVYGTLFEHSICPGDEYVVELSRVTSPGDAYWFKIDESPMNEVTFLRTLR